MSVKLLTGEKLTFKDIVSNPSSCKYGSKKYKDSGSLDT